MSLKIGKAGRKNFELPLDAITQKNAFLGRTGSGKTYGAGKLAEEMLGAGAQVVIVDAIGAWWGLRLAADGESPGIEIPVFGGLRGDIPLLPTSGAMVADLLADRRISVVLDISQFETDAEKARFATAFGDRFYWRKKSGPSPVHLFLEECQEIIPQNPKSGGDPNMIHAWTRIAKLGRNFGIGMSLISQRPQEVNKKALNMSECLFAFQMRGTQERKTVKDWLGTHDREAGKEIDQTLRSLQVGHALVSSPQWLEFEGVVAIGQKWTYDSSATPSFEDFDQSPPRALAPMELEGLSEAMEQAAETAKANDPDHLKKRVRELEKDLAAAARRSGPTQDEVEQIKSEAAEIVYDSIRADLAPHVEALYHALCNGAGTRPSAPAPVPREITQELVDDAVLPRTPPRVEKREPTTSSSMPRARQRILDALASLEACGVTRVTRENAAVFSRQSPKSSAYRQHVSALEEEGHIAYPGAGLLQLTDSGRTLGEAAFVPTSVTELHKAWFSYLPDAQCRVLRVLVDHYPDSLDRETLAGLAQQSPISSAYRKNVSDLNSLGIAHYPAAGEVAATDLLFPAGLR